MLSFTGRDPFFGVPYGDASRLNEDHSPSQASNGLYQLFETLVLTGPSPAQSPLAGISPSAARLTAQIAAPSPSYRGHSGVGGNALTDPSWSRARRVDDVVREPARLTDNDAAFTDARWPSRGRRFRRTWATVLRCRPVCQSREASSTSRSANPSLLHAVYWPFSVGRACWKTGARIYYGRARVGAVTAARNCGTAPKNSVESGALAALCFKGRPRVPSAKRSE
ncbi:hypothetical protein HPB51_017569 [Rhipicephalus microplus]|uniref:Uncharacterized protein n=1 Tax=Rhipicephalus microplus TaxID=6941 RepID=A0A9J6F678_RHIMP|nr:hypothetical protein HPB51_017569 [Rhipicephalus microplus]